MDHVPQDNDYGEANRQDAPRPTQPQQQSRKFNETNVWATRPITTLETRRRYLRHEGVRQEVVNTYAGLLREMLNELLVVPANPKDTKKGKRRYGAVVWTSVERDAFFRLLSRKGRSRIDEIAKAIPSKSVLEVQEYARMLHESLRRRQRNLLEAERISRLGRFRKHRIEETEELLDVSYADLPAAVEVSRDLELALDHFAESLLLTERHNLDKEGMKENGKEFWNIDRAAAEKIELWLSKADASDKSDDESNDAEEGMDIDASQESESDSEGEDVEADHGEQADQAEITITQSSIFLTAKLLNIREWIELSERIFMNFGGSRAEDNWRNLRLKDESPGLTADAFAEFYTITVNLTRRIVRAIIMRKMSQLSDFYYGELGQSEGAQKTEKPGASDDQFDDNNDNGRQARQGREEDSGYFITPGDVLATVSALGLNRDPEYYVGLARRFELDVIDERVNARPKNRVMDYDEVEALLSGRSNLPPARNRNPNPDPSNNAGKAVETASSKGSESQVAEDNTNLDDDDEDDDASDPPYVEEDDEDEIDEYDDDDSDLHPSDSEQHDSDDHPTEDEDDSEGNRLDAYLKYVDKKASREAETQLRQSLSCPLIDALPALESPQEEEDPARPPPRQPPLPTKTFADLYDWRDQTPYESLWETRRKRRRSEAELSDHNDG
ncbi:hypothetical protein VTN31DRAFT_7143 [Thermomyces dupontii]|uniref:uncharacterized protein n=1 Tax=Talaromyces thermophilus TaxID=28565 RepID=UPI003742650E